MVQSVSQGTTSGCCSTTFTFRALEYSKLGFISQLYQVMSFVTQLALALSWFTVLVDCTVHKSGSTLVPVEYTVIVATVEYNWWLVNATVIIFGKVLVSRVCVTFFIPLCVSWSYHWSVYQLMLAVLSHAGPCSSAANTSGWAPHLPRCMSWVMPLPLGWLE